MSISESVPNSFCSKIPALSVLQMRGAVVVDEGKSPRSTPTAGKARAQVAIPVAQTVRQESCGLKPKVEADKKSETYGVRFKTGELSIVRLKAQIAGCSLNTYIRASTLGSDYKPPVNPELYKILIALNRELTAQGRNLNQIAKHVNSGMATPSQAVDMLDAIRVPLVRSLYAVKNALVQGVPQP